jgi:hypothetical protein
LTGPSRFIATSFDIDAKTLCKHFRNEIDKGSIEATSKVAQSLFRMATEGKNLDEGAGRAGGRSSRLSTGSSLASPRVR